MTVTNITSEGLTFDWTNIAPNCSAILYEIEASGCGICPNNTRLTTVLCSDVQPVGDDHLCRFGVRTTACGYSSGLSTIVVVSGLYRKINIIITTDWCMVVPLILHLTKKICSVRYFDGKHYTNLRTEHNIINIPNNKHQRKGM